MRRTADADHLHLHAGMQKCRDAGMQELKSLGGWELRSLGSLGA